RWAEIEDCWVEVIRRQTGHETIQWLDPNEHLSWQEPEPPFELFEEDFMRSLMDYEMFKQGIDVKELKSEMSDNVFYNSTTEISDNILSINIDTVGEVLDDDEN